MSENDGHALVMELRQRYLECGICTEVYDEGVHVPKLLPCLHTFCIKCIITIHKGNSLVCPLCNQMHNLKKRELSNLPKDNTRRDLTDFLQKHKKNDLEKCAMCRKTKQVSAKCETCVMQICSDCLHKHQRKYPMHDFVIELVPVANEIKENDLCEQTGHDRGRLRFFCKDSKCEKVLCATCVIMEHKNHPVEDIDLMISDRKKSFQQLLQSVRKKHTTVKDLEERSKKSIQLLNDQAKTYRKKVNDSYAKGVQKLREKREKVIDCLEKIHERNEKRLNTTNEKLSSFLVNANECCKISEELLRNSSKSSFLTLERTVGEHLRNFLVSEIDQLDVQGNSLSNEIDEISNKFEDIINQLDKVDGTKQTAIMEVARFLLNASIASLQKIGRFLYQCLKLITVSLIILGITVPLLAWITPMHERDPGYVPDLHFDIEGNNPYMFPCNTADNKTVSTRISESGMICRQSQHRSRRIYGENGFGRRKEYHLDIKLIIEAKNNKKKKEKNIQFERRDVNDVIFEFGITTKKDDSSLYLYERKHDSWGITGYACKNDVGICLRTNEKQLFSEIAIFQSRRNKSFKEASFTVKIQLQKRRCEILSNDVSLHTFENVSNEFFVWPVYGIYDDKKHISFTITSAGQLFDRSTLFPNVPLFISRENTVFANRNSTLGTKTVMFNEFQRYVLIKPLDNFHRYENIIHIMEIAIPEFLNLPNNTVLLEMGFMIETPYKDTVIMDGKIFLTNSFTYYTSFFGLKKSVSYCIEDSLNKFKVCSLEGWFSGMRKLRLILNFNTLSSSIIFSSFNEISFNFMFLSKEPWVTMPRLLIRRKCEVSEPGIKISIRAPNVLEHFFVSMNIYLETFIV